MKITTLKCVELLEVLYELQKMEYDELGLECPSQGQYIRLPDGREDIKHRLWDEIIQDQWGNQQFNNDSFYRVPFEATRAGVIYTEELSDDMIKLVQHCADALNNDGAGTAFLLFDVCW